MISVQTAGELTPHVGDELGASEWIALTEDDFRQFGRLTGDEHWAHTDLERARRELPGGSVIAHGFFLSALVTALSHQCYRIEGARRWINYGMDRLRFTAPVTPEDRLRLRVMLKALESLQAGATRLTLGCVLEIDGRERPALVADWIVIAHE